MRMRTLRKPLGMTWSKLLALVEEHVPPRSFLGYFLFLALLLLLLRTLALAVTRLFKEFVEDPGGRDESVHDSEVDMHINGVLYPVSYWSEKGGRPYQEDRHQELKGASDNCSLYGVFDGHGGSRAAQYCKECLLQHVVKDPSFKSDPKLALRNAFYKTDAEFSAMAKLKQMTDGTTACVGVVLNGRVYVANAGDSRGIIVHRGGGATHMSVDHKPNREDEFLRISKLGGKVIHWGRWRVQGVLAVSRAIGDVPLQPFVTCEPEIIEREIGSEDTYLVLGSDGIWDVLQNEQVARIVSEHSDFSSIARIVCDEALAMGSTDNVTALVVDLRGSVGT